MFTQIESFLDQKDPKKIIVVYGPTASGKTALGIEIAKKIDGEIISTDSRQIFQYLNIGTGKVTPEEMQGIPHYMIDIIPPNQSYSVGKYVKVARIHMENIWNTGKIPILAWGTGLYIDALIYDFQIPKTPENTHIRPLLQQELQKYGKEYLYQKLLSLDPLAAKHIHPHNTRYIIRALEVFLETGISKYDTTSKKLTHPTLFLTPYDGNRGKLYENINKRIQEMFENGWIQEVENILQKWYLPSDFGLQTIGYQEIIAYIEQKISIEECISLVQQKNRNYAKRQLTWFRRYW